MQEVEANFNARASNNTAACHLSLSNSFQLMNTTGLPSTSCGRTALKANPKGGGLDNGLLKSGLSRIESLQTAPVTLLYPGHAVWCCRHGMF